MSRGVNKAIVLGTAGKDPEFKDGNTPICTLSLATNEKWKDKNGEMQERTEWHRVKFFGKLAEIVNEYVKKGSQLYVEGKLRTEKYTDKQGIERYTTVIIGDEMMLLGGQAQGERRSEGPSRGAPRNGSRPAPRREEPQQQRLDDEFPEDDIPF